MRHRISDSSGCYCCYKVVVVAVVVVVVAVAVACGRCSAAEEVASKRKRNSSGGYVWQRDAQLPGGRRLPAARNHVVQERFFSAI